ncbi:MAG: type II toxin-antitoxin system VapC family toxin [Spirochaetales bacterium]
MTLVIDASAAIEIALGKEHAPEFQRLVTSADVVLAPDTFPAEITNVFWKYARFSGLPIDKCHKGISFCLDLVDDYVRGPDVCREVFGESMKSEHSAYDVFYLVAARRNHANIMTRDKAMMETAVRMGIGIAG